MKYDSEFYRINDKWKAYVLGLFYSDGSIYRGKKGTKCSICLHVRDKILLEQIQERYPFFSLYGPYGNREEVELSISSSELADDLNAHGIYERKSFEEGEIIAGSTLSDELYMHFVRGVFDGDGTIFYKVDRSKRSNTTIKASIYSASERTLISIKERTIGKVSWANIYKSPRDLYDLRATNTGILELGNYMYSKESFVMQRKRSKYSEVMLNYKPLIPEESPDCEYCNSNKTRVAQRYTKADGTSMRTYFCRNCNKHFTRELRLLPEMAIEKLDELTGNLNT